MDNNPPIPPQPTTTTTTIFKRKRTKRQRPTTNATTHSSTSYNPLNSSPPSYSNFHTTTEDEDTAYCLILLSKHHYNTINSHIDDFSDPDFKFNSKKFIQTSSNDPDGRTGVYVYECKTCSRTFSSFQALGGHRASHTKPRIIEPDQPKPSPTLSNEDDPSRSPQLPLNHGVPLPINTNKYLSSTKLHECSFCGAEFNSGQALGGHMRRHRAANANTTTTTNNTNLSLIPYSHVVVDEHDDQKSTDDGLCLDLDLNLPAPLETNGAVSKQDQHRESSYKCSVNQNKQQPSVHLSVAPTLVDCYY